MLTMGLAITALFGLCLALSISRQLKVVEVVGLAFPLGIGTQMFVMIALDWCNVRLTAGSVFTATLAIIAALLVFLYFRRGELLKWVKSAVKFSYPNLSWAWLLCVAAIVTVVVVNVVKTLYYPTFDYDSIAGYDFLGKAIGHEGSIKSISIDTDASAVLRTWHTYPPLSHTAYGYVYMLGATTSKIVNALIFTSFVFAFYGALRRFATHLLTALITLFTILTPEMLGFSSMSGNNFTHALFASLGIIYFVSWYYKKGASLLWVSLAMLMLTNMVRSEGIAFIGAADTMLLWYALKNKQYKIPAIFAVCSLFPFIFWQAFIVLNHWQAVGEAGSSARVAFNFMYDSEKIGTLKTEIWQLLTSATYYGVTFTLFPLLILLNGLHIYRRHDHVVTLLLILLAYLYYNLLFYQLDFGDRMVWFIRWSYKRFMFSFVPLLWFYVAVNQNIKWIFDKVDAWIMPSSSANETIRPKQPLRYAKNRSSHL